MTPLEEAMYLARLSLDFGKVARVTLHQDGETRESDTTHTVMLGLVAITHAFRHNSLCGWDDAARLNVSYVSMFALVHDLVEAKCGDTVTLGADQALLDRKAEREEEALRELERELGREHWLCLWIRDYEAQTRPEARFVRYLDKVLPKLTHAMNRAVAVGRLGMTPEAFQLAHDKQGQRLREQYPEFPSLHALFLEASRLSEDALRTYTTFPEPNEGYADLMTLDEFAAGVECGALTDDDGHGFYSNGTHYTRDVVDLDSVKASAPAGTTHVLWFNK